MMFELFETRKTFVHERREKHEKNQGGDEVTIRLAPPRNES
jgi:hypothetical protein